MNYLCMYLLQEIDQHGKILTITSELINLLRSIMCLLWDFLMAKKLLINFQEMIKLPRKIKEHYFLNDLYK